jgi:hypothetical protein
MLLRNIPAKTPLLKLFITCVIISAQNVDSQQNASSQENGIDTHSILERYINAIGGREKLSKLADKKTVMKGLSGLTELDIEVIQKAPNKIYQSFTTGPMSQVTWFNGEKGRQTAMGREQLFEGTFLESLRIQGLLNLEMDYLNYGVTPVYSGIDTVNETKAYRIIWELPNGIEWIYYYAVGSGLLVKQVITHDTGQGRFTQTIFLNDYKDIDGIKFPHKFTQIVGGQVFELEVELLEINIGIDDSQFE